MPVSDSNSIQQNHGDINPDRGHIPALDGIRGMAVLMIMVFHFFQREDFRSPLGMLLHKLTDIGQSGVTLFFVLSGFLITGILLHEKSAPRFFLNFYGRRILRISPLYYLALAVFYFVSCPISGRGFPPISQQLFGWFYLINVQQTFGWLRFPQPGHFWTLAVEEQFYLLWPAVVFVSNRRALYVIGLICFVTAIVPRIILFHYGLAVSYLMVCQLDTLAVGCLLAIFVRGGSGFQRLRSLRPQLCLLAMVLILIPVWLYFRAAGSAFTQTARYPLLAITYGCLIASVLNEGVLRRGFASRWLRWFGKYSYGLYVWDGILHMTGGQWNSRVSVERHVHNPVGLIITCALLQFPICIVAAFASWHLFEKHWLRFKKYFIYQPSLPCQKSVRDC